MRLSIERKNIKVYPDSRRVISRFFFNGDERTKQVIQKVMEISGEEVFGTISPILQGYSKRPLILQGSFHIVIKSCNAAFPR